jgi:hypothetical protein
LSSKNGDQQQQQHTFIFVCLPSNRRRTQQDAFQARRVLLGVACLWPLVILALFASSLPAVDPKNDYYSTNNNNNSTTRRRTAADEIKLFNLRNALKQS